MHLCLFYETAPDYLERRAPHRPLHLDLLRQAEQRGEVVMAGALKPEGALIVFQADTLEAARALAETFARHDPYVQHGVVTGWTTKEWVVVTGAASR